MKSFTKSIIGILLSILMSFSLNAQIIQINQTFSSDTVLTPFSGSSPAYSLLMSGSVTLNNDLSFIRVILIDTYGNHYMVFESYPLIASKLTFDTLLCADETRYLDGIVCDSLRVDIINSSLNLESLMIDPNYIPNPVHLQANIKRQNDSLKVDILNQRIKDEHMYWRAGRTSVVDLTFMEKEHLFGVNKFYLEGFEYYKGGIFEFYSDRNQTRNQSSYVERFDWRYRHGASCSSSPYFNAPSPYYNAVNPGNGWLSNVQDQGDCSICGAYGTIGALEARVNLYYNYHYNFPFQNYQHIDLDLSEWDITTCNGFSCSLPPILWSILPYIEQTGVVDENCLSYPDYCQTKCLPSEREELVKIQGFDTITITTANEDWMKNQLINHGPLICTVNRFVLNQYQDVNHTMTLVGYKPINEIDIVYQNPNDPDDKIIIEPDSPLIGVSCWIFKNSWGESWGSSGFSDIAISYTDFNPNSGNLFNYKFLGDVYREGYSNNDIQCVDEDGDGFDWWGIGEETPTNCDPESKGRDCDDSDPSVGTYNLIKENGPLYECLPNCDNFSYSPYYIAEDQTIEWDRHFNCDVVVMPGVILTINNSIISFSPQAKLIIRQNAKVVINYSTLTTKCSESMWQGIEVWGNNSYSQSDPNHPQGKLEITNSTIEKARKGVTTVMYEYLPESAGSLPEPNLSGGIIQASNTTFKNNIIAVEFCPYTFENISFFNSCVFETNDDFLYGENPDYFVKMRAVGEIPFICCSFKNIRTPGTVEWYLWGGGIYSYNSSFVIQDEGCLSPPNSTVFEGLTRGIYAINSGSNKSIKIDKADFIDNYRGIYCSGMSALGKLTVTSNNLKVCTPPEAIETPPYGLYLDNSTGYHIEENSFWSNALWSNHVTVGLIINNSGSDNNLIYRNTFTELNFGIIAQDRNRSEDGLSGLEFKCNTFSTDPYHFCKYDISVTTSGEVGDQIGIKRYQGSNDDDPTAPAGNIFSDEVPPPIGPIGQYQLINLCNTFTYYYHLNNGGYSTIEPVRYYYYNLIIPTVNPTLWPFIPNPNNPNSSCPSTITDNIEDSDSLRHELLVLQSVVDSTITTINNLIDGGNTDLLNSTILLSWSSDSISLRNDLLVESPYLSDTVMISAIEKENVLSSEMITEILSANSHAPKSAKIMQHVAERNNQLTEEQLGLIYEGFNYNGELEGLELALSMFNQKYQNTFDHLTDHYRTSYQGSIASDSVIALSTSFGNVQKHYEAIIEALEYADTIMAWQIFNAIPLSFSLSANEVQEYDDFEEYLSIRNRLIYNGYSIMDPDSSMKDELYNLMNNAGQLTSAFARNMLIASDSLQYLEPIILPDPTLKQGDRIRFNRGSIIHKTEFTLYPNPASTYVIAQYDYLKLGNTGRLDFMDGTGRICLQVILRPGTKFEIINIADLATGIYLCSLNLTGCKKSTCTLVISR